MTFEEIMELMLQQVPDTVDKREGSVIWHTLGPVAAMVAELWVYGSNIHNGSIPDSSLCSGSVLSRKCGEHGVNRYPANKAVRLGTFRDFSGNPAYVRIGEQFVAESLVYTAIEEKAPGEYHLQCKTVGTIGNNYFGAVLPLESAHRLGSATLGEVIVPGEEEEADEELRARFYIEVNALPFGGNVDQYRQWLLGIPGVGNARVFPTPHNQGGRVHCVVVGPDNRPVSAEFVRLLQEKIDPPAHAKGLGTAPIGHRVSVSTAEELVIAVSSTVLLESGVSLGAVLDEAKIAVADYLKRLSFVDNTVRVAHVEAAILHVRGVRDIFNTTLNGHAENVVLAAAFDRYQVPTPGELTLTEG